MHNYLDQKGQHMDTKNITFATGDTVYSLHGNEGRYVGKVSGGHAVEIAYEREDGEPCYGGVEVWNEVFSKPPAERLHGEIARLEQIKRDLQNEILAKRTERMDLERDTKERMERIKRHHELVTLDLFITGKLTHLVLIPAYGEMSVVEAEKELETSDGGVWTKHKKLKLLTLYGGSNGSLTWGLSKYSDGSDSQARVIPAASHEQAMALARVEVERMFSEARAAIQEGRLHGASEAVRNARKFDVLVPDDIAANYRVWEQKLVAGELATAEKRLAEAQNQVNELRAKVAQQPA